MTLPTEIGGDDGAGLVGMCYIRWLVLETRMHPLRFSKWEISDDTMEAAACPSVDWLYTYRYA